MKICKDVDRLNRKLGECGNRKIVFTNGVFDLIHPGHIELLGFCRRQGDVVIIGINDDPSVKRLKGELRPIFPLAERMEILAAIAAVDFIIPFSEDTPRELIRGIRRIDVLVKGGDYRPDEVVGREEVEAAGGKLCLFPFSSAYSTSALIARIRKSR
jgi:D-glycero-beta-D-manno-heptose 1-phosphate adenylyltransferase